MTTAEMRVIRAIGPKRIGQPFAANVTDAQRERIINSLRKKGLLTGSGSLTSEGYAVAAKANPKPRRKKAKAPSAARLAKAAISVFDNDFDLDVDAKDIARLKRAAKTVGGRQSAVGRKRNPQSAIRNPRSKKSPAGPSVPKKNADLLTLFAHGTSGILSALQIREMMKQRKERKTKKRNPVAGAAAAAGKTNGTTKAKLRNPVSKAAMAARMAKVRAGKKNPEKSKVKSQKANPTRRKYDKNLSCQDCGRSPATRVTFWVNGMKYRVCSSCIKEYRNRINRPESKNPAAKRGALAKPPRVSSPHVSKGTTATRKANPPRRWTTVKKPVNDTYYLNPFIDGVYLSHGTTLGRRFATAAAARKYARENRIKLNPAPKTVGNPRRRSAPRWDTAWALRVLRKARKKVTKDRGSLSWTVSGKSGFSPYELINEAAKYYKKNPPVKTAAPKRTPAKKANPWYDFATRERSGERVTGVVKALTASGAKRKVRKTTGSTAKVTVRRTNPPVKKAVGPAPPQVSTEAKANGWFGRRVKQTVRKARRTTYKGYRLHSTKSGVPIRTSDGHLVHTAPSITEAKKYVNELFKSYASYARNPANAADIAQARKFGREKNLPGIKRLMASKPFTGAALNLLNNTYARSGGGRKVNPQSAIRSPQSKRNPPTTARRRTYELFQGRRSENVRAMAVSRHAGASPRMDQLGDLVELKLANGQVIKLNPDKFKLCALRGRMWIVGGKFARSDAKQAKHVLNPIEYVDHVVYRTHKPHHGDPPAQLYIHKLGEVSGKWPLLTVDNEGFPVLKNGAYKIRPEGIVD